ncbi:MAG: type IV pilus biogenesis/stability protein PilW [gamma proteobacterium symbiont of Bathyaustriella thionipta]|nr:type IV pilus biogenesis/stability protein PilW [gamma proteobacterium symbiont of Bathyaustriella thionipta]MCU7955723.1 type IV pilus biogenesis/stability protein PilW [gamma proteobacterium symbiont of Bathyaustriella thionipta]MCU7967805.1 type IV pilus biogenesis/stability protein PilW [gamma proteobacterium symbiont of Bathyaustriella thionipta]
MKKVIIGLFSAYVLTACQSTAINPNGVNSEAGLSTQYSDGKTSGKSAADINTQLGAGYIANGRYDRALIKLTKAIQHDSEHALAHNYLGVLYSRLERPQKATQQFKKSIQLAPNDSTILNNYAIFLCEQKKFDEARIEFKKVLDNPLYINRSVAYQSAAWCALENNNLDLSEKLYNKAVAMSPNLPGSLLGLAKINYKKGNFEYAWSYFERFDKNSVPDADGLWLGINILNKIAYPDKNLLSSYELLLKNKYPDTDETKWLYQGKQEY